jgi:hypothetical protein
MQEYAMIYANKDMKPADSLRRYRAGTKHVSGPARFFRVSVFVCLVLFYGSIEQGTVLANANISPRIALSGSGESWTDNWVVEDSVSTSPEGLTAGFHRQIPPNLNLRLPGHRRGIVCIFPGSRYKPAKMVLRGVRITREYMVLKTSVAASRQPRGRWELAVKINNDLLTGPVMINGNDDWQDMEFNLSSFLGQTVDLEIEARMIGTGRNSSAFFDTIDFIGIDGKEKANFASGNMDNGTRPIFDDEYLMFLELLYRNEEIRHDRMMDRVYMDRKYNDAVHPSVHKINNKK